MWQYVRVPGERHAQSALSLTAAEAVERLIAGLGAGMAAAAIADSRPSLVDRTIYWFQYIDQIERALGLGAEQFSSRGGRAATP